MSQGKLILTVIIYLIAYAIDPILLASSFNVFLRPRSKSKQCCVRICFWGTYIIILVKQFIFYFVNFDVGLIFVLICFVWLSSIINILYSDSFVKKMSIIMTYYMLSFIVEGIFSIVFIMINVSKEDMLVFGLYSAGFTLIERITDILIWISLREFYQLIIEKSTRTYMFVVYMLMFGISCFTLYYYFDITDKKIIIFLYSIQTLLIFISIVFVSIILSNVKKREDEAIKRAELSESKLAFLNYSREKFEEIKSIRHDMKKHYNTLLELSRRKEYKMIEHYLVELSSQLISSEEVYVCDNLVLAVALSDAQRRARMNGIEFTKSITVNIFPFTDTELNSVITNILDNAFEASSKIITGKRMVKLEIRKINEHEIMFFCENTYKKEEYASVPFLTTTKWNKDNHGYGTKIVRKIVQSYSGTVVYWSDEKKFYVKIIVRENKGYENSNM